jgi:hypothetical protein
VLLALVEQGALEEQEGGTDFPGEVFREGGDDEAAFDGEGIGGGDVVEGTVALVVEVAVEEDVDGGHAAGEVELAVEPARGADREGFGELVPGEAEGELEEDEVQKIAVCARAPWLGRGSLGENTRVLRECGPDARSPKGGVLGLFLAEGTEDRL